MTVTPAPPPTKGLVELPFFTTQPDTSRVFCDTRKSAFMRQVYARELRTRDARPRTSTTTPAPGFAFRPEVRDFHLVRPFETAPYAPGPGPRTGESRVFPRFDFNIYSTALSSRAYGSFHGGKRVPLHLRDIEGARLDELLAAHRLHTANDGLSCASHSRSRDSLREQTNSRQVSRLIKFP